MKNAMKKQVTKELLEHLKQMNIKSQAWIDEDPKNRWSSMITEDPKHWANYKIYTLAEFKHYMAETMHWDLFKEVNGIRPRWMNYHLMTTAEIEADLNSKAHALFGSGIGKSFLQYLDLFSNLRPNIVIF